jgi:hypothetical protein
MVTNLIVELCFKLLDESVGFASRFLSFTPRFSRVPTKGTSTETAASTGLKPGVNEKDFLRQYQVGLRRA